MSLAAFERPAALKAGSTKGRGLPGACCQIVASLPLIMACLKKNEWSKCNDCSVTCWDEGPKGPATWMQGCIVEATDRSSNSSSRKPRQSHQKKQSNIELIINNINQQVSREPKQSNYKPSSMCWCRKPRGKKTNSCPGNPGNTKRNPTSNWSSVEKNNNKSPQSPGKAIKKIRVLQQLLLCARSAKGAVGFGELCHRQLAPKATHVDLQASQASPHTKNILESKSWPRSLAMVKPRQSFQNRGSQRPRQNSRLEDKGC